MSSDPLVSACRTALAEAGLFAFLRVLNASAPYRYTGIYRFDGPWVKSVWLYDREHPDVECGSDVLWDDSYCRITAAKGDTCEIVDSRSDVTLEHHAARDRVQCYVAVLLRNEDGTPLGTLCHYDVCPRVTPRDTLPQLQAVRLLVEEALRRQLAQRFGVGTPVTSSVEANGITPS